MTVVAVVVTISVEITLTVVIRFRGALFWRNRFFGLMWRGGTLLVAWIIGGSIVVATFLIVAPSLLIVAATVPFAAFGAVMSIPKRLKVATFAQAFGTPLCVVS